MTQFNTTRLCIGLPVYSEEPYLAQAIESLLAQTFTDFRLIISDNASTRSNQRDLPIARRARHAHRLSPLAAEPRRLEFQPRVQSV